MQANRLVLWFLGLLLLTAVAWYIHWFFTNFEQVSEEVRADASPEARKNQFLAAEIFLRKSDQSVQSYGGRDIFELAPGPQDAIFLGSHSELFLRRNHDALLKWVESGGHLILVPPPQSEEGKTYELMERIGVERVSVYSDEVAPGEGGTQCSPDDESGTEPIKATDDLPDTVLITFNDGVYGGLEAEFPYEHYLNDSNDSASVAIGLDGYPNILRFTIGSGFVTTLSHVSPFSNEHLAERDHGFLLHTLVRDDHKVWIFYSAAVPSLPKLMWQNSPYVLLAVLLLSLFFLWRMILTSGPRLTPQSNHRRNLLEGLEAAAAFQWRIDHAKNIYQENRDAVEQSWRRRHPVLNTMGQSERSEWIAKQSGVATSAVERTLYGDIKSEQDFIRATNVLQSLTQAVNSHRR